MIPVIIQGLGELVSVGSAVWLVIKISHVGMKMLLLSTLCQFAHQIVINLRQPQYFWVRLPAFGR